MQGVHILHDSDRVNIINGSGLSAPKKCAATGCGSTTGKGTTCYIQDGGQNGMHGTDMKRMNITDKWRDLCTGCNWTG